MTKFADPSAPARFEPADNATLPPGKAKVAYLFRVPRVADRIAYRRAVAAAGGRRHYEFDMLAELRTGVLAIARAAGGEPPAEALGLIEDQINRHQAYVARVTAGDFANEADIAARVEDLIQVQGEIADGGARLVPIRDMVAAAWAPYATMVGDNAAYAQTAGLVAANLFLTGWEGLGDFERGRDGLSDAMLRRISERHLIGIGFFVEGLFRPTEAEAGNSASPSGTPPAPTAS